MFLMNKIIDTSRALQGVKSIVRVLLLLPCSLPFRIFKIRILQITMDGKRIGHLVPEVDLLWKKRELGIISPEFTYILFYDKSQCANTKFIEILPSFIRAIATSKNGLFFVRAFLYRNKYITDNFEEFSAIGATCSLYSVNSRWNGKNPLFDIKPEWRQKRLELFSTLGIPLDRPYICLHAREGGYAKDEEHIHCYRSVDVSSFRLTAEYLNKLGYFVVRMGDSSMTPIHCWGEGVFDYALSTLKSPELDLALAAECDFFIGTASGAIHLPVVFGRPIVYVGGALLFSFSMSGFPSEIGIPKLIRKKESGTFLSFKFLYESRISEIRIASEIDRLGLEIVENTEIEILEVVEEMLGRLKGTWIDTAEDLYLQSCVQSFIKPGSFCYGTSSRFGSLFLRRHKNLIEVGAEGD
jgi:putative glycosyltransferase (TIGR04372 family)